MAETLGLCPGSAHASHCHRRPQTFPLASSGPAFPWSPVLPLSQRLAPGQGRSGCRLPAPKSTEGGGHGGEWRSQGSGPRGFCVPPCRPPHPAPGCHQQPLESGPLWCILQTACWRLGPSGELSAGSCWRRPSSLTSCPPSVWLASGSALSLTNAKLPPGPGWCHRNASRSVSAAGTAPGGLERAPALPQPRPQAPPGRARGCSHRKVPLRAWQGCSSLWGHEVPWLQ